MPSNKSILFKTERLFLRNFRKGDWKAVHAYASDPEVVKYMDFGPNTEKDTKDYIQRELAHQNANPRMVYNFALIEQANRALIGVCTISIRSSENREGEIGYILHRGYWNQGYTTEAARRVAAFGFEQLKLHRIRATCDPSNTGSYRVMEKIGMQREGHIRSHRLTKGAWRDSLLYSILEDEWQTRK